MPGTSSRIAIKVRFGRAAVTEADPGNNNRLSTQELVTKRGNKWAAARGGRPRPLSLHGPARLRACRLRTRGRLADKNCKALPSKFRESFADDGRAGRCRRPPRHAEFSNGESVEFEGQKADGGDNFAHSAWFITKGGSRTRAGGSFEP